MRIGEISILIEERNVWCGQLEIHNLIVKASYTEYNITYLLGQFMTINEKIKRFQRYLGKNAVQEFVCLLIKIPYLRQNVTDECEVIRRTCTWNNT